MMPLISFFTSQNVRKNFKVLVSMTAVIGLLSVTYVASNSYLSASPAHAASTSGPISSIDLSNSTLTEQTGQQRLFNGSLIPGAATSTGLTATFTTGTATWANGTSNGSLTSGVASSVPVTRGHNTITVTHTAPDTTETVYTIYVDRTGIFSDIDIRTSGVTITPAFDPSIH